jgi:hypothetical protein
MSEDTNTISGANPDAELETIKEDRYSSMWGSTDTVRTGLPLRDETYDYVLEKVGDLCCKVGRYEVLNAMFTVFRSHRKGGYNELLNELDSCVEDKIFEILKGVDEKIPGSVFS